MATSMATLRKNTIKQNAQHISATLFSPSKDAAPPARETLPSAVQEWPSLKEKRPGGKGAVFFFLYCFVVNCVFHCFVVCVLVLRVVFL